MAANNSTILGKIWMNGTNDYQQRVPNPSQANISRTMKALFDPMNRDLYNQFMSAFINLIGQQRVHNQLWKNPLTVFKDQKLMYGSTIQESAVKWIQAHAYDDASEELLKLKRPEAQVWYHTVNREDKYTVSVVRDELIQAFHDEYGLNRLINAIMNAPINSDNYDEFNLMMNLISEYEHNWGFYKQHVSALPTDEATGKEFLTSLRAYANKLNYPSTQYNAADVNVPVFANREELVLIIDAETDASVDVNTLASVFNLDKADIKYRKVVVPSIPVDGAFALLTTDAFFVVCDKVYQMDNFYNPDTLATTYFLHHWEVVSASPFVPAILFTTKEGTGLTEVTMTPAGIEVGAYNMETDAKVLDVAKGEKYQLKSLLEGTVAPQLGEVQLEPDAVTWDIAVLSEDRSNPSTLNSKTYVDRKGVLHIQKTGLVSGDSLVLQAESTYINPDGETPNTLTGRLELSIK